jgi:hypothetical protein
MTVERELRVNSFDRLITLLLQMTSGPADRMLPATIVLSADLDAIPWRGIEKHFLRRKHHSLRSYAISPAPSSCA